MAYTVVDKGSKYFDTTAYTGNGSAGRNLTTGTFQPDWVWIKSRTDTDNHRLIDAVRGATVHLESDNTSAEQTSSNVTAFTSTGITLSSNGAVNANAETYVVWSWLGANTTVTNNSGTISSTVSANTTSGFSIVSYTGNGTSGATVGHGLGAVPKMMIVKQRAGISDWRIYHVSMGNTNILEFTTAAQAANLGSWNNTTPTSSVFSVGNSGSVNASGATHIAYCFAEVKGFSKFGSYTGNNANDGPFVYTGFKPAFILLKPYDGAYNWTIIDNKRNPYNVTTLGLIPNTTSADTTGAGSTYNMDILSNGFKPRYSSNELNGSLTYIYMAFSESPFVSAKGIPTTAR